MQNKVLTAAVVFGIIVISTAVFLGQTANIFSKAQAPTISGTVVLLDDLKFFIYSASTASQQEFRGTVALPATSCSVSVAGCCSLQSGGIPPTATVSFGSVNASSNSICASSSGSLGGGSNYLASLSCGGSTIVSNLSVSYVCN